MEKSATLTLSNLSSMYKYSLLFIGFLFLISSCGDSSAPANPNSGDEVNYPEIEKVTAEIAKNPNRPDLYIQRAETYISYEAFDQAIRDLQKAISLDSNTVNAWHLLADAYMDYYNSRMAMNTMYEAADRFPERVPTLLKLAEYQFILQFYNPAIRTLNSVISLDPQNGDAWFWMGMVHRDEGRTKEGIRAFQKATELDPFLTDAWLECGKLLQKEENPLALRYFQNAVQLDSTNELSWHAFAEYYQEMGRFDESIATYRRLIGMFPLYAPAYLNSGLIYFEMDSLDQAKTQFDLTIKTDPTLTTAYLARANTLEKMGDTTLAKQDYQQVLLLEPDNEKAIAGLKRIKQ